MGEFMFPRKLIGADIARFHIKVPFGRRLNEEQVSCLPDMGGLLLLRRRRLNVVKISFALLRRIESRDPRLFDSGEGSK